MLASQAHPSVHAGDDPRRPEPQGHANDADELDSARLLHGQREVLIRHGSELYRLRHTRNDKLILTK